MNFPEIRQARLANQRLAAEGFRTPEEVVSHFGAIQAQDYAMAKWGVGLRMKTPSSTVIGESIDSGEIVRTHILRPTWHFVSRGDIRWMMALSAPQVKKAVQYVDKQVGLTDELYRRFRTILEKAFAEQPGLTKQAIIDCLAQNQIMVGNLLAGQLLIRAELDLWLCNAPRSGKTTSYALFEERVPPSPAISAEESLARLALLYFRSRGPATLKDFTWWSGLGPADAQTGINALGNVLRPFSAGRVTYFFTEPLPALPDKNASALLPPYDEYTVSYTESRDLLLPEGIDKNRIGNGIFKPLVLHNGVIAGTWSKNTGKKSPFIVISALDENHALLEAQMKAHTAAFEQFLAE